MRNIFLFLVLFSTKSFAVEIYNQECRVLGEDDFVQYQIEAEPSLLKDSTFILKLTAFEDENCLIPYLRYNQYFVVETKQGDNLNLKTSKITYATLSDEVSETLNLMQYCGITNWNKNSEQDVTGQICDEYQQLAKDQTLFQIFKQIDNTLYLGNIDHQKNGRDESRRPNQWDELGFTKVITKPSLNINRIHF